MANSYSVSQINSYIKRLFSEDFALTNISVKGEISNCKYHSSGHIYFTLKDGGSVLAAVMFAGNRNGLSFALKEGMKVVATGSINVYERDGKYQLYAKSIKLDGEGELYRRFEELKNKLLDMGMFDSSYKRPIPKYAMKVGVVTAKTGAAIQDILNISKRRNPYAKIYLYSAIVQGENAKASIVRGIKTLDEMDLDVIIVGRGGGSIEDLWAFNEEEVARAIFNSKTPIISAVGHETDTTIADYVADFRAPTPSAAAELAFFEYESFLMDLQNIQDTLYKQLSVRIIENENRLNYLKVRLENKNPVLMIDNRKKTLDNALDRLNLSMKSIIEKNELWLNNINEALYKAINNRTDKEINRLKILAERLNGKSPLLKLESGFSYVSIEGKALKSIDQLKKDDSVIIELKDGLVLAVAKEIEKRDIVKKWY